MWPASGRSRHRYRYPAAGLSRATLDNALLRAAEQAGAEVRRGVTVREIAGDEVRLADGARLRGAPVIAATGKHALRGTAPDRPPGGMVGLRTTVAPAPGLDGVVELHLFRHGYAGLLLQEDGRANLCLSIAPEPLAAAGSTAALVERLAASSPLFAARLAGLDARWDAIAGVAYGWRATAPGPWRVGDQAAVIASLVGDGVAMALASGRAAGRMLLAGAGEEAFRRRFARRARLPLAVAETMRRLAERPRVAQAALPLLAHAPGLIGIAARLTRIGD